MKYLCILIVLLFSTITQAATDTECRMVIAINKYRHKHDLPDLKMDPILMKVARQRAPYFSHCIHGKWMWDEVKQYGYWATDDIAAGYESAEDCVDGWISSDGHARQMRGQFSMNGVWENYKPDRIGVARCGNKWIAVFGKRLPGRR